MRTGQAKWSMDSDGVWVSFLAPSVGEAKQMVGKLKQGKKYEITIKEESRKRSLSANALMWAVLGEMAAAMSRYGVQVTTDEIYRKYIRDTANYYVAEVWEDQLESLKKTWSGNGIGWIAEETTPVYGADGMEKWAVRLWYGTSQYSTSEMCALLDAILQDARQLGIDSESMKQLMAAYPNGQ